MPNTNPCPTCHAQLDPGTPHTFCARTKEPKARELATRIAAMEANFDLLHRLTVDKREKDSLASKMDNLFGGGIDLATRLEALERAKENTGAALGDGSERQPSDSHGQHEEPGRSDPLVEGQRSSVPVAVDPYKLTDEEREELSNSMFDGWDAMDHGSAVNAAQEWIESLVTRAVRDTIQHGGGLERNATPREGRCPSPAASALPMPERPVDLDEPWRLEHFEPSASDSLDVYRDNFETAEEYRLYALSLESRLAESNKHRNEYAESNLRTASKLADMSEAFARERADRDALKEKLAECEGPNGLEAIRSTLSKCWSALGITGVVPDPIWALVKKQREEADWLRPQVRTLTADRDALRAKLDGVREAAETWTLDDHAKDEYMKGRTVEDSLNAIGRAAITSALAAAENTGDAGRTPAGQCSTDRSTDGQPPTSTEPAVDEPGPVTNPAVSHPSPATAFELTDDQGNELYEAADGNYLCAHVEKLVNSELRKAREGYAQLCESQPGHSWCASAIRAASKEASDG